MSQGTTVLLHKPVYSLALFELCCTIESYLSAQVLLSWLIRRCTAAERTVGWGLV